ncbi:DUF484 family protein [Alkalilimnicola ehrlichii MLHE-1]|uniref:Phytochrome sensor protein n=1 Tax=Alkalilimnicola ehrlichii (strain ATCC BAA-1101 / DSM 17681 / MLHE-1) TaxID=187272 RepID=Q0ACL8_ALKEH|nr:DUF484 family protein [Alkalilimnicola ehrlichii]ABI55419.1 protein of unknown function DUF484 [Alkalilimnicola ehrlichii MLHE-1]
MQQTNPEPQLTDEDVAAWLEADPQFLLRHPGVMRRLELRHDCAPAVSLIERQVQLLRHDNERLRAELKDLLAVARYNDRIGARLHQLTLELMRADALGAVVEALRAGLREGFQADAVALLLLGEPEQAGALPVPCLPEDDDRLACLNSFIMDRRPRCGRMQPEQLERLFGTSAARINSAAIVPLIAERGVQGLLGIGSHLADRFHEGQGTVYLGQLGSLAGEALAAHRRRDA